MRQRKGELRSVGLLCLLLVLCGGLLKAETLQLHSGWQLFGAPGAEAAAGVRESLSEHQCELYSFGTGDAAPVRDGAFESVRGYWLFCPEDAAIQVAEAPVDQQSIYISLNKGWNVVTVPGGRTLRPESSLRVGGRRLADSTDIRPEFYEYDPARQGYFRASTLQPWRAYFVYANAAASLEFMTGAAGNGPGVFPEFVPFTEDTPVDTPADGPPYVAGQLLISFGAVPPADADAALRAAGLEPVGFDPDTGVYQARVQPGADADRARDALTARGAAVSRNYILSIEITPYDEVFISPPEPDAAWAYDAVGLPEVWGANQTAASPIVAVVDTGVDASHPDLAGRVVAGANFIAGGSGTDTTDQNGHGTQVAGVIAAQGDNHTAIAGMCPGCRILPVKVCDASGRCPLYSVLSGIGYASSLRVPVVNISLGAAFPGDASARALFENALAAANTSGTIIVAAAGNKNSDAADFLPAAIPAVISVGAIDKNLQRAPFSNFGADVDIAAPGADVYTTTAGGDMAPVSGTSVSAAFVSGLAARMLAAYPEAPAVEIRNVLAVTSKPLSTDRAMGAGLIDAPAAMRIVRERLLGPSGGNDPPRILSMAADPPEGAPATVFTLAVQAEDPDGGTLRYAWTAPAGKLSNPDAPLTTWDASGLPAGDYTFFVSVADNHGASAMDVVTVKIQMAAGDIFEITPPIAVTTLADPFTFTARLRRTDGSLTPVSAQWSIDDPAVGAMDDAGVFHPAGQGETDITAVMPDGATARARIRAYDPITNPNGRDRAIEVPEELDAMAIASGGSWSWTENSEFMIGSVTVKVVFIESNGTIDANTFNWTPAEITTAYNEIKTGLQWWTTVDPRANLSFNVLPYETFQTGYEPTLHPSNEDYLFINQYLLSKGYNTNYGSPLWNKLNNNRRMNDDLRTSNGTEWAYTIYVVTGNSTYTDGHCGYAYLGGPYVMMTKNNNGWGLNNMDKVTAHETGHIFRALDQYSGACSNCTSPGGYLGIANSFCYVCSGSASSMMKDCAWIAETSTRQQLGWRDSDGDNVFDPMDPSSGGSSSFTLSPPAATVASGTPVDLTASLINYKGDTIPGATVTFTTTAGSVSPTPVRTGLPGTALTTLSTICASHTVTAAAPGTGDEQSVITGTCAGAAEPQNATATVSCPDVTISWTAGSDPLYNRYTVKRATVSGGPYTQIATGITTTSYTDPNPGNGTYYYVVIAYKSTNPADQTAASNEASVTLNCSTTNGMACGSDWPTFHCNNHQDGRSSSTFTPPLAEKWKYYSGVNAMPTSAVVSGNKVILGTESTNKVLALDKYTGAKLWEFTGAGSFNGSPAVSNNAVFIGSLDDNVYSLDLNSGAKNWQYTSGGDIDGGVKVESGKVFFGSNDKKVYALNEATGAKLWDFTTTIAIESTPAVADGKVFIGSDKMYGLDSNTGAKLWEFSMTGVGYISSSAAVADGKVFFGGRDNRVYALDENTGAKVWEYTTGGMVHNSSPAVANGKVFIGSMDNKVYALDENTGIPVWTFTSGNYVLSSPVVTNGHIFVGSHDYNLYMLNINTGAVEWKFTNTRGVARTVAISDQIVFIGLPRNVSFFIFDGYVYAFEIQNSPPVATATVNCPNVDLTWTAAAPATYDRYTVKRATTAGGPYTQIATGITTTSYTDPNPGNGTYYYIVIAYKSTNPADQTAASNEASATLNCGTTNGAACDTEWPKYHCNNHSTGEGNTTISLPLSKKWEYTTGGQVNEGVSVVNGIVYAGSKDGKLYALNKNTGAKIWEFLAGTLVAGTAAVADGRVFFGSGIGKFYAADAATGAKLWEFNTTHPWNWSAPAVNNGTVFFTGWDKKIHALNVVTGIQKWSYTFGDFSFSAPAVADGLVFAGSGDHKLYAFNETTGAKVWEFTTGDSVQTSPTVANGIVYIGSYDDKMYALNELTGSKIWEYTTGDNIASSPAVANGTIYFGSGDGKMYALDGSTGAKKWETLIGDLIYPSPAVVNGMVFVGSHTNKVYILDEATGAILWEYLTGDDIASSPAVVDGVLYIGSRDNKVYAFESTFPPTNVTAAANCPDVTLTWTAAMPAAFNRYTVKRAAVSGGPYVQIATGISTTSYTDPNPGNGTYYYIVIGYKSTNPAEQTAASSEASVTLNCSTSSGTPCDTSWPSFHCNNYNSAESTVSLTMPLAKKWEYTTGSSIIVSPVVADGRVIIGSNDSKVYAFNQTTGAKLWEFNTGMAVHSSPAIDNGKVYVGSDNRRMYALNAVTGAKIWEFLITSYIDSAPHVANDTVYFGGGDSYFYAVNATTGAQRWRTLVAGGLFSAPAVANGRVYASVSNRVYAFNETTGAQIWTYVKGSSASRCSPTVGNGMVYNCGGNIIYALSETTGVSQWQFNAGSSCSNSTPALANGYVYVGCGTKLYALNAATGAKKWEFAAGSTVNSSPAVAGGKIYVGSDDRKIYVIDEATGAKLWEYDTGNTISTSSPAVVPGWVFIGSGLKVYAFEQPSSTPPTVTATANCPDVNLTWTAAAPASYDRYTVKRATASGGPYTQIATGLTTTSYTDPNPGAGTYYYIVIGYKSTNPADQTGNSNEASVNLYCSTTNGMSCGTDWPLFQCNSHTNGQGNGILSLPLSKKWDYDAVSFVMSSPVIQNGKIFFSTFDKKLYALDKVNGTKLWSVNTNTYAEAIAADSGMLFITRSSNRIEAYSQSNGALLWAAAGIPGTCIGIPIASGGVVYFTCNGSNKIYAFDQATGAKIWDYTANFNVQSHDLSVADGIVFFSEVDGVNAKIIAISASNATKLWDFQTTGDVNGIPTVNSGKVLVASRSGYVYALDELSGVKLWERFLAGKSFRTSPAVAEDKVFVAAANGTFHALDANTGLPLWEYSPGTNIIGSPAYIDGKVIISLGNFKIVILDAGTGTKLWEYTTGGGLTSPIVSERVVYVGSYDNRMYAFEYQPTTPPSATATLNCPDVELTWSAASPASFDRYTVYRASVSGGPYTQIATNVSATSYTDAMPGEGLYYYVIEAYESANPANKTGYSNEVYVEVGCDVTLNVTGTCNPMLMWSAAPAPLDRYTVSRSGVSGGPYTDIATNISVTDYTDTTALDNTTYYYIVTPYRSTNPAKKADPSSEASLTTNCAPWGLVGEMRCPEISLVWQSSNGTQFNRYTVFRGTVSGGPYTQVATGLTTTSYDDAPPSSGQTYYYVIQAYENANPASKTGYSNEIMIKDFTCPYPKPQNLAAALNCPDIDLTWDDVPTASGYNVYRAAASGGPYTRIDEGVASPYTDTTTVPGTTYYYVVTAFFNGQAGDESGYSNEAGITNTCNGITIPKPPFPVTAAAIMGGVTLDWTAPTQNTDNSPLTDLAGYKVYRSTVSGGPYSFQQSLGLTLTWTDMAVVSGTTYCYVVTAFDSEIPSNESAYSMEVCQKPLAVKPYTYDFDCGNNIPPHFSSPTPPGELYRPFEVTTDTAGYFYVANTLNNRIEKYDANCTFVKKWGSAGGLPSYMTEPRGIVYNPVTNLLYVTDEYERVQAFTTDGVFQSSWYAQTAKSLGVDGSGALYVVSNRNGGTLFKRDPVSGNVLAEWLAPGIKGVAVNDAGEIFITSGSNVKQLDNTGAVVSSFTGTLAAPAGIHFSPDGRLFISDITLRKVEIYAPDGTYIDSVGKGGLAPGEFSEPTDVWVISNDKILVLDRTHDRISRFSQK